MRKIRTRRPRRELLCRGRISSLPFPTMNGSEAPRQAAGEQEQAEGCLNGHGPHRHGARLRAKTEAGKLQPPSSLIGRRIAPTRETERPG
jgi:hypothetical protein